MYRVIIGKLVFRTAAHVGSGQATDAVDAWLRRDSTGRIVIPGTAIAGALRACATRLAPQLGMKLCDALKSRSYRERFTAGPLKEQPRPCACPVCKLFGDLLPGIGEQNPQMKAYETETGASRILVADAYLLSLGQDEAESTVRDSVGIDRVYGAAARAGAVKFDLEALQPNAQFELRIELTPRVDDEGEVLLAAALAEWVEGRGALGGRTSRGFGAIQLCDVHQISISDDTAGVLAFLHADEPWKEGIADHAWLERRLSEACSRVAQQKDAATSIESSINGDPVARTFVEVTFALQGDGPMLANDATVASLTGFDHAPVIARWPNVLPQEWQPNLILPGSSLRGALRAHAEKIARTLTTLRIAREPDDHKAKFIQQCPACNPVESRVDAPLTRCDELLKDVIEEDAEPASDDLCLACRLFGSTLHGSRLKVEDAVWAGTSSARWFKVQDFLAIDRFTGGGLDGAKFDALAVMSPRFTVKLRIENPQLWELGWLALVLRDLRDGMLHVGMGASKGYGRVVAKDITVRLGAVHPADRSLLGQHLKWEATTRSGLYQVLECAEADRAAHPEWSLQIRDWVESFHEELGKVNRNLGERAPESLWDSYFGTDAVKLYPILQVR